jgi:hypothetical protein
MKEFVVKKSFHGSIREKRIIPELEKWVTTVSKAVNSGSLIFNRYLLHCLNNDLPLSNLKCDTIYNRCINSGGTTYKVNPTPELDYTKRNYFKTFPAVLKDAGNAQAYSYARGIYKTNFITSLCVNFEHRQKNYIQTWLNKRENVVPFHSAESHSPHNAFIQIRNQVNNWKNHDITNPDVLEFIRIQKELLSSDEKITCAWIKKHPEKVVKYYFHILKYLEQHAETKKFTLAPISKIKRHFIRIDVVVLFNLLKNSKLIDMTLKDFKAEKDLQFSLVFKYKPENFSYIIDTDSTSICFHYQKIQTSSGLPATTPTPVRVKRIIGIDPGRVNLIFAAEKINGKTKTYRLTKKCYYNSSGMTKARKRNAKWQKQIEREEKIFSTTSPKTSDPNVFDEFLRDYISVYHILWPHKTQAKYSRERFRCYTLKRKTLDLFFNNFSKDKSLPKPYIAYGGAKFSATSRNEISAPTSSMLTRHSAARSAAHEGEKVEFALQAGAASPHHARCRNKFPTKIVDEFRTTKVCFDCESVMSPIREVRGMTRCTVRRSRTCL